MSLSLLAQVALAAGPIVAFLEGTVVYALSQQWEDLLSTYLFRLHAVPNCGEHLVLACSAEASAPRQFRYVAGLLATSALVQASRLYLPYISPTSPLYLLYISPISRLHSCRRGRRWARCRMRGTCGAR